MISLFDTASDFDQPIGLRKRCHDRIREQTALVGNRGSHYVDR